MHMFSLVIFPDLSDAPHIASSCNAGLRILLSGITLVSGVGKLMDPAGSRQAMGDFGVPSRWVDPATRVLPIAEIALGGAVLIDFFCKGASLGLALLFLLFSLGIGNLLRQDKAPPCNCFGAVHSEPVSAFTLARALSLSALAALCAHLPVYPLTPDLMRFTLVGLGFGLGGWAIRTWVHRRMKKGLHKAVKRLTVGQRVPSVKLGDGTWLEQVLPGGKKTLLVLTSSGCGPCKQAKASLSVWANTVAEDLAVIELRREDTTPPAKEEIAFENFVLSVKDFARFLSPTPGGFLVDEKGTLLSPPVAGVEEIEALARLALETTRHHPG